MQSSRSHDTDHLPRPVVLSSVPLAIRPARDAQGSNAGASASADSRKARHRHVLGPRAINPYKDLVALLSQDVDASSSDGRGSADPYAGLPPPPPGMSATQAAALMRMRMIARAKALAQQNAAGGQASSDAVSGSSATTPKLNKGATIRLSLWRMSSIAGQLGERVWDVSVKPPTLFDDLNDKSATETEEVAVDALTWSPDGQVLALAVRVIRRQTGSTNQRLRRLVALYALQDGKCIAVTIFPDQASDPALLALDTFRDMQWIVIDGLAPTSCIGEAQQIIRRMGPLPSLSGSKSDSKDQKTRHRQRLIQSMRDPRQAQAVEEKTAAELMVTEGLGKGKAFLVHPRALTSPSTIMQTTAPPNDREQLMTLLQVSDGHSVHSLLDASIYLGAATPSPCTTLSADISIVGFSLFLDEQRTTTLTATYKQPASLEAPLTVLPAAIDVSQDSAQALVIVRDLSSLSHSLLTYMHDCCVAIKTAYLTFHAEIVVPWNKRAISIGMQYGTTFTRESMILLTTGIAAEAAMTALLGNGTPSEKDLKALQVSTTGHLEKIESLVVALERAAQRLILVYEDIEGCARWTKRFGTFFPGMEISVEEINSDCERIPSSIKLDASDCECALDSVEAIIVQSGHILSMLTKEKNAYNDFYTWWSYERVKQEAVRDDKPPPELSEACVWNVVTLSAFVQRGFDNLELEALLDVTIDDRSRGVEVEDDEEDETHDDALRDAVRQAFPRRKARFLRLQEMIFTAPCSDTSSSNMPYDRSESTSGSERSRMIGPRRASEPSDGSGGSGESRRTDASGSDNASGPVAVNERKHKWHDDEAFSRKLEIAKANLELPPAMPPYRGPVRKVPGRADVRQIAQTTDMHNGPLSGFARRQQLTPRCKRGSLINGVHEVLTNMSGFFYNAFAGWMKARAAEREERSHGTLVLHRPLADLCDVAPGTFPEAHVPSRNTEIPNLPIRRFEIRMQYHKKSRTCLAVSAGYTASDGSGTSEISSVQVSKIAMTPGAGDAAIAAASVDMIKSDWGRARLRDAQLYSSKELVVLLDEHAYNHDDPGVAVASRSTTTLMSFHLDDLPFEGLSKKVQDDRKGAQPHRYITFGGNDVGVCASMLACNHNKEVLATLDEGIRWQDHEHKDDDGADTCELVYWDMVKKHSEHQSEDDDSLPEGDLGRQLPTYIREVMRAKARAEMRHEEKEDEETARDEDDEMTTE